jgi:hypothetical protein
MKHHAEHIKHEPAKEHYAHPEHKQKSHSGLKIVLGVVIVIILIAVLVLGYFGYVPGLSDIMGANTPKDLGVKFTQQDLLSAREKANIRITDEKLTPAESMIKYGKEKINKPFTQEELTAVANDPVFDYYPIKDVQIRINPDNTVEVSGKLDTAKLEKALKDRKFPEKYVQLLSDYKGVLPPTPPVYFKGKVEVTDGKLNMDFDELEVGKIKVPKDVVANNENELTGLGQGRMDYHEIKTENAKFEDGKFNYKGSIPSVVSDMTK